MSTPYVRRCVEIHRAPELPADARCMVVVIEDRSNEITDASHRCHQRRDRLGLLHHRRVLTSDRRLLKRLDLSDLRERREHRLVVPRLRKQAATSQHVHADDLPKQRIGRLGLALRREVENLRLGQPVLVDLRLSNATSRHLRARHRGAHVDIRQLPSFASREMSLRISRGCP